MTRALGAIRVLDLSNVLAGPFCAYQFALLGADVIKVELPGGGDLARQLGADSELNAARMGASFLAQNAGKRSLTLDLKTPAGQEVLRRLVRTADVLIENFRPGVMERLGVGHEELMRENPRLIYCAISGFGQHGPMRAAPAYDQIIQGLSGMMSITGSQQSAPMRAGFPVADTFAGMTAAFAIAAALVARQASGQGTFIDVSMLDAALTAMGWAVSNHLIAGVEPQPHGNDNVTASPSGAFRTRDGLINIAANQQAQFETLMRVLELPGLVADPRFATREARKRHRAELTGSIERALSRATCAEWESVLTRAGIPAGCVLTVPQALALDQVRQRELIRTFDEVPGVGRPVAVARAGFRMSTGDPDPATPPPRIGEHSDDVLRELGYGAEAIERLRRDGAI